MHDRSRIWCLRWKNEKGFIVFSIPSDLTIRSFYPTNLYAIDSCEYPFSEVIEFSLLPKGFNTQRQQLARFLKLPKNECILCIFIILLSTLFGLFYFIFILKFSEPFMVRLQKSTHSRKGGEYFCLHF